MKKKALYVVGLLLIVGLFLTACGEDEKETLIMGTSADYPPFESRNPQGEIVGFDIDLANYIADELGFELEIRDMDFNGLVGALQADRIDVAISGMSADEDRRKNVDFSVEYHRSGEVFVTQKGDEMTSLDDLNGMTIGVQLGSIQQEGAVTLQEEYEFDVHTLDDAQGLIQELLSNRIDAVYLDREVALGFIKSQDLIGFDDPSGTTPGMAVAFPKGSELVDKVNEVIEQAIETGELAKWEAEWFSE